MIPESKTGITACPLKMTAVISKYVDSEENTHDKMYDVSCHLLETFCVFTLCCNLV